MKLGEQRPVTVWRPATRAAAASTRVAAASTCADWQQGGINKVRGFKWQDWIVSANRQGWKNLGPVAQSFELCARVDKRGVGLSFCVCFTRPVSHRLF
jgi:hypothetical protein